MFTHRLKLVHEHLQLEGGVVALELHVEVVDAEDLGHVHGAVLPVHEALLYPEGPVGQQGWARDGGTGHGRRLNRAAVLPPGVAPLQHKLACVRTRSGQASVIKS